MSIESDYELALRLQKELCPDFDEVPAKKIKKNHSSIVDSEWEKLDPNPDIYVLFQTFDKKFFWSSLDSVEVKWSKRMYSCAGVCTYKGKRGGCSISLSFPLLQLRPRKDLVETLLHEMIHAYLFLTANKQDREEHGPLFHQHMNRINKTAGTKITVYHSFHDEVAHYKQHWWRCNGPCQHRKPFFGLVKRSMNRAPGPNDFWHDEHKASCGGEFIKIKEPDNFKARKSKTKPKDTTTLTKYFPKQQESSSPSSSKASGSGKSSTSGVKKKGAQNSKTSPSGVTPLMNYFSQVPSQVIGNKTFGKSSKDKGGSIPGSKSAKSNNIHGFSSHNTNPSESASRAKVNSTKPNLSVIGTGLKSNKGGTLVMNPKPGSSQNADEKLNSPEKDKVIPFSGMGHVLAPGGKADRSKSILLTMFENKPPSKLCDTQTEPLKTIKNGKEANKSLNKPQNESVTYQNTKKDEAKSPTSNILKKKQNDGHSTSRNFNKGASSSGTWVPKAEPISKEGKKEVVNKEEVKKEEVKKGEVVIIDSDSEEATPDEVVSCPVCGLQTLSSLINEHLDECTGLLSVLENVQVTDDDIDFDLPNHVQCPSCGLMCPEDEINVHLDACLS